MQRKTGILSGINTYIRRFFLIVVILTIAGVSSLSAADSGVNARIVSRDTSLVNVRMPEQASLDRFRNDSEFRYTNDFEYSSTFLDYVRYFLAKLFRKIFGSGISYRHVKIIMLILLVAVAVYVAAKMFGIDVSGIFFKKPPSPSSDLSGIVLDENVDRNRLNAMLEKALAERQYRLAVRLTYLIVLRRLAETEQIRWQPDKTNRSYLNEINDRTLREPFSKLARMYEYVWYGDFDITDEHYRLMEADFDELNRRMR